MRTRYRFLHRADGRYYWESAQTIGPTDSRHEEVSCPVGWFWIAPRSIEEKES